jgi:hypothetical protein
MRSATHGEVVHDWTQQRGNLLRHVTREGSTATLEFHSDIGADIHDFVEITFGYQTESGPEGYESLTSSGGSMGNGDCVSHHHPVELFLPVGLELDGKDIHPTRFETNFLLGHFDLAAKFPLLSAANGHTIGIGKVSGERPKVVGLNFTFEPTTTSYSKGVCHLA